MPNPPDAAALMMSARSFGNYDLPSALADLVDNSLKARARTVHISCLRSDAGVEVRIRDDGEGMSVDALAAAMRPASANPEHERSPDDLGRFGWGLKSASFSQCRRVTVVSNSGDGACGAEWDLDSIDGWRMGLLDDSELAALADPLVIAAAGTEVVWRNCDRLSENETLGPEAFNALVVHEHDRGMAVSALFCGVVRGVICGLDADWPNLDVVLPVTTRAVGAFAADQTAFAALIALLRARPDALLPVPGLDWILRVARERRAEPGFWTHASNGERLVLLLRDLIGFKALSAADRDVIVEVADILIERGVKGAAFLQQDLVRRDR